MQVFYTIEELKKSILLLRAEGKTLGFVPTMGALHEGHMSLIYKAKQENHAVLCSIFVNPTQFNDKKDLEKYPRTIQADMELLISAHCDMLFAPFVEEMYNKEEKIQFDFGYLDKSMEANHRPGHFNGVATIVKKFLDIIEPDAAYFGQKDFQQLLIVKHLVKDLQLNVKIVDCPTLREKDGLAMSSRNVLLSVEERTQASFIYQTLSKARYLSGERSIKELQNWAGHEFEKHPLMQLEYFEIIDAQTLLPIEKVSDSKEVVACIAVKLGNVRLIDNIILFP